MAAFYHHLQTEDFFKLELEGHEEIDLTLHSQELKKNALERYPVWVTHIGPKVIIFRLELELPQGAELQLHLSLWGNIFPLCGRIIECEHKADFNIYTVQMEENRPQIYLEMWQFFLHNLGDASLRRHVLRSGKAPARAPGVLQELTQVLMHWNMHGRENLAPEEMVKTFLAQAVEHLPGTVASLYMLEKDFAIAGHYWSLTGVPPFSPGYTPEMLRELLFNHSEELEEKTRAQLSESRQRSVNSFILLPLYDHHGVLAAVLEVMKHAHGENFSPEEKFKWVGASLLLSQALFLSQLTPSMEMVRYLFPAPPRDFLWVGKTPEIDRLRGEIGRAKSDHRPNLLLGPSGAGKTLAAQIILSESNLGPHQVLQLTPMDYQTSGNTKLFSLFPKEWQDNPSRFGLLLEHVEQMPIPWQKELNDLLALRAQHLKVVATAVKHPANLHSDLLALLSFGKIVIPSLAARGSKQDDVAHLVHYFLKRECRHLGVMQKELSPAVMDLLQAYDWPGNVRELQRFITDLVQENPDRHFISDVSNLSPFRELEALKERYLELLGEASGHYDMTELQSFFEQAWKQKIG